MKTNFQRILLMLIFTSAVLSCKKAEYGEPSADAELSKTESVTKMNDSISSIATQQVEGKQFIKNAEVKMEVKDVYQSTIAIEKSIQALEGFITSSNLSQNIVEENTYDISDEKSIVVRKYRAENEMKVRVPTLKLSEFLQELNDKKLFLASRIITAEDVSQEIQLAKLEKARLKKMEKNVNELKTSHEKVGLDNDNEMKKNMQAFENAMMTDNLKYSTISIFLTEPKLSLVKIEIPNTHVLENEYKHHFGYELQKSLVTGFYGFQSFIVGLFSLWPFILIASLIFILIKKKNKIWNTKFRMRS